MIKLPLEQVEQDWLDTLGSYAWLKALTSSWMLWSAISLLFLVAVFVKRRRTRRRKRQMEIEERDWEYKDPTYH